jgi:EAL domain-containing protein (putative c-di-GMP-specific phosphodiesterase class I)
MTTIAEGIEDPDQLRLLHESGCPFGQGYLLAKPLEADEISALLGIR